MAGSRKNIIVIGGGAFGIPVARAIAAKLDTNRFRLIVLTPRPFYVHLPGLLRTLVTSTDKLENQILMPYGESLSGKGEYKVGTVASFTSESAAGGKSSGGEVILTSGERIAYSVLVLTPGSVWEGPLALPESEAEIKAHFDSWRGKIAKADSVVLVGGGAVGVELAGELKEFHPTKYVTVIHGKEQLLNDTYPLRYRSKLLSRLKKSGAAVVLGDYAETTDNSSVVTRNGKKVNADLVIPTSGARPNSEFIAQSLGSPAVTASGHVKVLPTLQLPGHPNIFAGGDVIDWDEQKQMFKAAGHAEVIAKNVLKIAAGRDASASYKGAPEIIIANIGRTGGATYFGFMWGLVFGDWVTSTIKSKGLIIDMIRGNYGLGRL